MWLVTRLQIGPLTGNRSPPRRPDLSHLLRVQGSAQWTTSCSLEAQTESLATTFRCLNPTAVCAGSSAEVQLLADWMPWLNGLMTELQDAGRMKELEIMAGLMQHVGTFLPSKVAAGVGDWGRQAMAMTEPEVWRRLTMVAVERVPALDAVA